MSCFKITLIIFLIEIFILVKGIYNVASYIKAIYYFISFFLIALSINVFAKDVYIIHGYKSTSNYGWFNAVAQKLSKNGKKSNIRL